MRTGPFILVVCLLLSAVAQTQNETETSDIRPHGLAGDLEHASRFGFIHDLSLLVYRGVSLEDAVALTGLVIRKVVGSSLRPTLLVVSLPFSWPRPALLLFFSAYTVQGQTL